jgi:hypothetical protein
MRMAVLRGIIRLDVLDIADQLAPTALDIIEPAYLHRARS